MIRAHSRWIARLVEDQKADPVEMDVWYADTA
jgi:hypothetical protein